MKFEDQDPSNLPRSQPDPCWQPTSQKEAVEMAMTLQPLLNGILTQMAVPQADIPDVLQGVFVIVSRKWQNIDVTKGSLKYWLFAVTRNAALHYFRRRNSENRHVSQWGQEEDRQSSSAPSPSMLVARVEVIKLVRRAMVELPSEAGNWLKSHYWDEISQSETAELFGKAPSGAATTFKRIRVWLRALIEHNELLESRYGKQKVGAGLLFLDNENVRLVGLDPIQLDDKGRGERISAIEKLLFAITSQWEVLVRLRVATQTDGKDKVLQLVDRITQPEEGNPNDLTAKADLVKAIVVSGMTLENLIAARSMSRASCEAALVEIQSLLLEPSKNI